MATQPITTIRQFLRDLLTQFSELMAQQTLTKKIMAGVLLVLILGTLVFQLARMSRTIDYQMLYSDLDAENAQRVRQELKAQGVDPQVRETPRGYEVRVPAEQVLELRLDTVDAIKIDKGRVGFEIFDQVGIGVTNFTQKVNLQRAREGELARTIMAIDQVRTADVNLAIPPDSVFQTDVSQPKASVLVELYPNTSLSRDNVATIQALVAGAVPDMTRENVVVADQMGNELTREELGVEAQRTPRDVIDEELYRREKLIEQQTRQREDYEQYLESKIVGDLAQIFGPGHAAANVSVDFDFTRKTESVLSYDDGVLLADAMVMEGDESDGPRKLVEGLVGSTQQIMGRDALTSSVAGVGGEKGLRTSWVKNYLVGQTESTIEHPPFQIDRITAAVFVDNLPAVKTEANPETGEETQVLDESGEVVMTRKPLETRQLMELEDVVKSCINFVDERDSVKVVNLPFTRPTEISPDAMISRIEQERMTLLFVKIGVFGGLALLILFFILRPLTRIVAPSRPRQAALERGEERRPVLARADSERYALEGAEGVQRPGVEGRGEGGVLPSPAEDAEDVLEAKHRELDDEIMETLQANPKKAPMVLRAWIESQAKP